MDPYYFLDISSSDSDSDLSECCECEPNGNWTIDTSSEDYSIIYNGNSYDTLKYINDKKTLYFFNIFYNIELKLQLKLELL